MPSLPQGLPHLRLLISPATSLLHTCLLPAYLEEDLYPDSASDMETACWAPPLPPIPLFLPVSVMVKGEQASLPLSFPSYQ